MNRTTVTRFRDLAIGQAFDFVDDSRPGFNSYFERCVKISSRQYVTAAAYAAKGPAASGSRFGRYDVRDLITVGSINARVFHVEAAS